MHVLAQCASWWVSARIPSMWPHFLNLLHRSWDAFLRAEGTTGLGWIGDRIVLPIGAFLVALFLIWLYLGRPAMKEHWGKLTGIAFVAAVGVFLLWHGTIFAWNVVATIYDDHHSLVERLNAPKPTCPVCATCPESKPCSSARQKLSYYDIGEIKPPNPKFQTKHIKDFIITTDHVISPVRLLMSCNASLVGEQEFLLGYQNGSWMDGMGWEGRKDDEGTKWGIGWLSPAWSPKFLVSVVAYYDGDEPFCSFEEK